MGMPGYRTAASLLGQDVMSKEPRFPQLTMD
jgi:hypothetical protein